MGRKAAEVAGVVAVAAAMFLLPAQILLATAPSDSPPVVVTSSAPEQNASSNLHVPDKVALDLQAYAASVTEIAPKPMDADTVLTGGTASGRTFTYHYAYTGAFEISDAVFLARIKAVVVPKVCADPKFRTKIDDDGVTYRYAYRPTGRSDELILSVDKAVCAA